MPYEKRVTVIVWGEPQAIRVYRDQSTKTRWIATGRYRNEPLDVRASSEGAAIRLWREKAQFKGEQ